MKLGGLLFLLLPVLSWGATSTTVLPEGVNSPSFRFGSIQGIDQKYTENGSLMKLGDFKSVSFDVTQLSKFNPDAKKLIDALNRFGSQRLGDSFNLGVLRIETAPAVKYFAPVYARGITSKWTLGLGVPVVNYTNRIQLSQQFSNIAYYRQQFSGIDPELDAALNTDLGQATNQTLTAKGYKALSSRDETFIGDVQVVSLYKFFEDTTQALNYQLQLSLPTGPQYNPDDLAAINIFGRTTVVNTLAYSKRMSSRWTAVPYVSYMINITDKVNMRVPTSETDTLPEETTKEILDRKIGNTSSIGGNIVYDFSEELAVAAGYEASDKDQDAYRGGRGQRYELLDLNTAAKYQKARAEVSYSSVKSYFSKQAMIPAIISYQISDIIAGINIERQLTQELNVMLFF
ncbi:MAG: hypothetical protein H7326_01165 [Bdellovibrionaceae bacterium]|nr:hypothetical protein [Pseudobdellovibrionaceae bacterium]